MRIRIDVRLRRLADRRVANAACRFGACPFVYWLIGRNTSRPRPPTAIGPRQGTDDEVLFFVAVEDVAATLARAEELGGTIVQPPQQVPGVTFGVLADAQGHKVGVAAN